MTRGMGDGWLPMVPSGMRTPKPPPVVNNISGCPFLYGRRRAACCRGIVFFGGAQKPGKVAVSVTSVRQGASGAPAVKGQKMQKVADWIFHQHS